MERCFPEALQTPALGSAALVSLRGDLTKKIQAAKSQAVASQDDQTTVQPSTATLARTTNRATTYASSGSARVDLFFKYKGSDPLLGSSGQIDQLLYQVPLSPFALYAAAAAYTTWVMLLNASFLSFVPYLQAWQEDPLDTLKLIAHLRDVRGGKGEQKLFHECATWLEKHHPLTLITNLPEIVKVTPLLKHYLSQYAPKALCLSSALSLVLSVVLRLSHWALSRDPKYLHSIVIVSLLASRITQG